MTNPGDKEIYRIYDRETGKIRADLICLADEVFDPEEDMVLFDPNETWKRTRIKGGTYRMRRLLEPIFDEGKCVYTSPNVWKFRISARRKRRLCGMKICALSIPQKFT